MSYGASNVTAGALAYTANADGSVTNIDGDAIFSGTPQTAIEKAMTLCPLGKHIEVSRGEYSIGPQLRFYRSIIGNGAKFITNGPVSAVTQYLIAAPSGNFGPSNMVQGIIISGLELDGNTQDYAAKTFGGLQARYAKNIIIENCRVHDFPQSHGIQLQSGYYCTVRGCTISDIGDSVRSGHYGNGICSGQMYMDSDSNYPAAYNLVEDCDISLCSMVGLNWEPGNNNLSRRVVVHDILPYWMNGSKKVRSRAVTTFSKTGLGAQNGNIYEDCIFPNDGVASSFNGGSIIARRCKFSTPKATDEYNCGWALFIKDGDGSVIEDCTIQYVSGTSAGHGISFVSTVGATISGTTFDTLGTGGIDIYKDSASSGIVVKAVAGTPTTEATEDDEPAKEGGFNDAVLLLNLIKGGAVARFNKAFGSSGNANSGSEVELSVDGEWPFICMYMENLKTQGVTLLRTGIHDWQGTVVAMADPARTAAKCQLILDAAQCYGLKVVLVLGGFSDSNTAYQAAELQDVMSDDYADFVQYAAQVADALKGYEVLELLELLNEPDYVAVTWDSIAEFKAWLNDILSDVRLAQASPGVPLGMGTAVDSSLVAMDWWGEISGQSNVIDSLLMPCDVASVHTYIGDDNANSRDVWVNQKLPAFVASAKRLGKKLIVGETGLLSKGGVWDAEMATALKSSGLPYCWMVRWWDPTVYEIPGTFPARPNHSSLPETPEPPTEPGNPDSSEPSEPGEDTTEEPPVTEPEPPAEPPVVVPEPEPVPVVTESNWIELLIKWLMKIFKRK